MSEWPNSEMKEFPHDWCICDEERGWWVCRIENRFEDPGDGEVYEEHNITVLHYAGDHQWSYEEDAYNPANFGETGKRVGRQIGRNGRAVPQHEAKLDAVGLAHMREQPAHAGGSVGGCAHGLRPRVPPDNDGARGPGSTRARAGLQGPVRRC